MLKGTLDRFFRGRAYIVHQSCQAMSDFRSHVASGGGEKGLAKKKGKRAYGNEERLSRLLSKVLRHSAEKDGLKISSSGYVSLVALRKLQKFREYELEDFLQVALNNEKQRFHIICDPYKNEREAMEALHADKKAVSISDWFIRANQGHSIDKVVAEDLLEEQNLFDIDQCVHGTTLAAWELIEKQGLKRMKRNHVHFAPGLPEEGEVISGMRFNAEVAIFLNCRAAANSGLRIFKSKNNVLLSPGFDIPGQHGVIPSCFFEKVVNRKTGEVIFKGNEDDPKAMRLLVKSCGLKKDM